MSFIDPNTSLDQFLLAAPDLRQVFAGLGIDARRDGGASLAEVCQTEGLDMQTVVRLLAAFEEPPPRQVFALELMTLVELCDHLERTQRIKLQENLARLDDLMSTAAEQRCTANPRLLRFREIFDAFREQFTAHLRKEAEWLFPLIRRLSAGENGGLPARSALKSRLARMENEHNQAEETFAELRALARGDSMQSLASAATPTIAEAVARLDDAIQEQIYAESLVLFPRALALGCRDEHE